MFRNIGKLSAIGAGVIASLAGTVAVVNAKSACDDSGQNWQKQKRYSFPEAELPYFKKWNWNWDRLEPGSPGIWPDINKNSDGDCIEESTTKTVPQARRNIILVRHGQYNTDNTEDDQKHTLTALGQEQAAMTGQKLRSMGIKFDCITSSGMIRAIQTATIVLENMKTQDCKLEINDPLLNEGVPCVPEPPYRRPDIWCPDPRDVLVDGSRIESAFRKYFHRADPSQEKDSGEIIVCHGNVIRYFACRGALQFPPEGWLRISIDDCSIARFTILPSGEVILRGLGDSGHIPYDKTTA